MTEQEAHEYMENEIRCIQRASYCDRDCAKCNLVREDKPLLEAFGVAIKALEKQIAKKPVGLQHNICPNCSWGIVRSNQKYCDECGQKLDREV